MDNRPHVPPILVLAGAFGLQSLLTRRKRQREREEAENGRPRKPHRFSKFLALTKLGASLGLIAGALVEMRRAGTTIDPTDPSASSTLVTSGVFAATRNPIYLGMAGLLAANALRRRSVLAMAVVPAFMAVLNQQQIPLEENALSDRFGSDWQKYAASVPRWICQIPDVEG